MATYMMQWNLLKQIFDGKVIRYPENDALLGCTITLCWKLFNES